MLSLRQLLDESRSMGELKEITQPMDWCEEMSGLNYMVAQRENAPVLWFKNVKDARYGSTAVFNLFGTGKDRIALSLGTPEGPHDSRAGRVHQGKLRQKNPAALDSGREGARERGYSGGLRD